MNDRWMKRKRRSGGAGWVLQGFVVVRKNRRNSVLLVLLALYKIALSLNVLH